MSKRKGEKEDGGERKKGGEGKKAVAAVLIFNI